MSTESDPRRRYAEDIDLDIPVADPAPAPIQMAEPEPDYLGSHDATPPRPAPERQELGAARPVPRDHMAAADPDAGRPVYNEALGILVVPVEFDGMKLEVPADPEDWPVKATLAFEDGKVVNACKHLLSSEDFDKVMAKNYRNKKFGDLFNALAEAGGFANSGN